MLYSIYGVPAEVAALPVDVAAVGAVVVAELVAVEGVTVVAGAVVGTGVDTGASQLVRSFASRINIYVPNRGEKLAHS